MTHQTMLLLFYCLGRTFDLQHPHSSIFLTKTGPLRHKQQQTFANSVANLHVWNSGPEQVSC